MLKFRKKGAAERKRSKGMVTICLRNEKQGEAKSRFLDK